MRVFLLLLHALFWKGDFPAWAFLHLTKDGIFLTIKIPMKCLHSKKIFSEISRMCKTGLLFFSLSLSCIVFFSCASSFRKKLHPVYITDRKCIELLPPSACSISKDSAQEFSGDFDGKSFSLMAYLKLDKDEISVCLLSTFGVDIGSLFYDGNKVLFESAFFPDSFKAEYIVADFQNAYYDFDVLKENYSAAGLSFKETKSGSKITRTIHDGKTLIEEIDISMKKKKIERIKIRNHLRNYTYVITEVDS